MINENFIKDLVYELKIYARDARKDYLNSKKDEFKMGISFGYFEVIKLMIDTANDFGINLEELGLDDIDPYKDLLGISSKDAKG